MSHIAHPAGAGIVAGYVDNPLILPGKQPVFLRKTVLKSGALFKAGSVLGKITAGAVTSGVKASGANTGDGTFVLDVTSPKRISVQVGRYTLRVTNVPAAHGSVWELKDPRGISLGNPFVAGSGGTKTVDNQIKGVLTDAGTDWVAGDGFDIDVAAGSSKYILSAAAAEDGSAEPVAILGEEVDATGADKNCPVMIEGYFNETALVLGTGHTVDTVRVPLQRLGILLTTMRYSG